LLIVSAALVSCLRIFRYPFQLACGIALISTVTLDFYNAHSMNLELLTIGLLGVVFGYIPATKIAQLRRAPNTIALVLAYCVYLAAITLWNVPFGLRIAGVCLTLALVYVAGTWADGPVREHMIVLGKYSLLGYIAQIAILQGLHKSAGYISSGPWILPVTWLAGFGLTMLSVELVDRTRRQSKVIDRCYRVVFA
jgi:hypothetical protein